MLILDRARLRILAIAFRFDVLDKPWVRPLPGRKQARNIFNDRQVLTTAGATNLLWSWAREGYLGPVRRQNLPRQGTHGYRTRRHHRLRRARRDR